MSDEVYCILDTSIFLQCTFFPDVDWLAVLSAKQVCLLVPITVLDELDKHKTDPASNRRRERARRVIRELNDRQAASSGGDIAVRRNVRLRLLVGRSAVEQYPDLDPSVNDDRIIASALTFS